MFDFSIRIQLLWVGLVGRRQQHSAGEGLVTNQLFSADQLYSLALSSLVLFVLAAIFSDCVKTQSENPFPSSKKERFLTKSTMFYSIGKFMFMFLLILPSSLVLIGNGKSPTIAWFWASCMAVNLRPYIRNADFPSVLWCLRHLEWSPRCWGINILNETIRKIATLSRMFYFWWRRVSRVSSHSLFSLMNRSCCLLVGRMISFVSSEDCILRTSNL